MESYLGLKTPISEIYTNLYLGTRENANNEELLLSLGITHIISISNGGDPLTTTGRNIYYIQATTEGNLKQYFGKCYFFIQRAFEQNGRVLVHCQHGIHRSPTIVASYLIRSKGYTMRQALEFIVNKRNIIDVPVNLEKQLTKSYNLYCKHSLTTK